MASPTRSVTIKRVIARSFPLPSPEVGVLIARIFLTEIAQLISITDEFRKLRISFFHRPEFNAVIEFFHENRVKCARSRVCRLKLHLPPLHGVSRVLFFLTPILFVGCDLE